MPSKNQITEALKQRIMEDDKHHFFREETWLDTTFGLFYDNDEEFIDKAVFEVTEHLVKEEGRTLPKSAALQLEGDVSAGNTPGEAIDPMFIAAGKAGKTKGKSGSGKSSRGRKATPSGRKSKSSGRKGGK